MSLWPEEVTIVEKVGKDRYDYQNGSPCCAVGYMREAFDYWAARQAFMRIYKLVALTLGYEGIVPINLCMVESINDSVKDPETRVLYYNTTMAVLGYTKGQSAEVQKLAKKVHRIHKQAIRNIFCEFNVKERLKSGR